MTFEIFQVRTNNCMSITDFKRKIASKYETKLDNVIITYAEKEFNGKQS
jgi:ribosomal protein S24E